MAMAADSTPNSSPVASSMVDGDVGSPHSRRRGLTSPWAQVVRGGELESVSSATGHSPSSSPLNATPSASSTVPEKACFTDGSPQKVSPENSISDTGHDSSDQNNGNASRSKNPAWNKPLNGVVEATSVMGGADCWPALSESTRPTSRSSSDAVKPNSDGSVSTSQGPIIVQTPQRPINTNTNANSSANHGLPGPRSTRHRGSGNGPSGSVQVGYTKPPPPPPPPPLPPVFPAMGLPTYSNFGNLVAPILDTPVRGVRPPTASLGLQSGSDHSSQPQRNSSRRNSFGPRPRANGQHYHNNGSRRDNDSRNANRPHQFIPPGSYIPPPPPPPPPPPGAASFIAPNMRPLMTPMGFDMNYPIVFVSTMAPEPFRGMPLITQAPPAPMYFPTVDLYLPNRIMKQIDYYFSDANLVQDGYLISQMDEEGWVPINLIANFPRVQQLTTDTQLILESLRASVMVEVKGDKLRRRNEWKKWMHTSTQTSVDSGSHPPAVPSNDNLATSVEKMSLNDENTSTRGSEDTVDSQEDKVADESLPAESIPEVLMDKEQSTD